MSQTIDSYVTDRPPARPKAEPNILWRIVKAVASLRLTVVLFALSLLLVLAGTLGQVDADNWVIVRKYFRTFFVWVPFQIFVPRAIHVPGGFPYPGGWLIGAVLLVNLLAAHLTRFRLTWKRSGILILHAGLIVMLFSELITGLFAVESHMTIAEGETVNFLDVSHEPLTDAGNEFELTLTTPGGPDGDIAVAVPVSLLRPGETIRNDQLPVDVDVLEFHKNSDLASGRSASDSDDVFMTREGMAVKIRPAAPGTGVSGQRDDAPMVRVAFREKETGRALGKYLLSLWQYPNYTSNSRRFNFAPQTVTVGGKTFTVELRPKRRFTPYAIRLLEFRHDKYIGSDIPRNYSSRVRLMDPSRGEDREILISMNTPLRYDGLAYFQSGVLAGAKGTILQVVRNPGWLMPYISCVMVSLGMAVHFGIQLNGFLRRRAAL